MNTFQTIDISALNTITGGVVGGFGGVVGRMPVVNRDVVSGVSKVGSVVPKVPVVSTVGDVSNVGSVVGSVV